MIDIRKILEAGQAALDAAHAEAEKEKTEFYRVGSAGVVGSDGQIYGTCHRIAMARSLGIDKDIEQSQKILFMAGQANESGVWEPRLKAGFPDGLVLAHEQLQVDYLLPNGKRVMGHPDFGLADKDGKVLIGLELKGCFSYGTTTQVYLEGQPKNENLVQAAAYSLMLGSIPYVLCYTAHSWTKVNFFDQKKYPVKNIKPFDLLFYLRWNGEVLEYRDERKTEWVNTKVTKQGIIDYYLLLEEMKTTGDLGPRVNSNYVNGTPNKWGEDSACGICDFADACSNYDVHKDFAAWLAKAKEPKSRGDGRA